jgi:hypothetical protein
MIQKGEAFLPPLLSFERNPWDQPSRGIGNIPCPKERKNRENVGIYMRSNQ